ncbi:YbfB/YjiJ family MFS transporter [Kutzneria buriramensis]|uniref:Putative MFS family arabinose efflux permease n=1 Tax=Kutzneria buriramensis TaxID=1045776 RepID=A0A3E0HF24_9PSEU|nr:YbfB/YjiJ family MFS transporter [Kutzneria buriramensis]REH43881.1 putative MFS family arabinose efflux permease [Kutzneria buriramensis]
MTVVRTPWLHVGQSAAALAASMGIGRFVFTPILPLMVAQAGLSAQNGAELATANYFGYLVGALAGALPVFRRREVVRASLVTTVLALAAMPVTSSVAIWLVLRFVAGIASAVTFVAAVGSALHHLRGHLPGWAFGGIGGGIALSGILVLCSVGDWRVMWWVAAGLAAVISALAWNLDDTAATSTVEDRPRVTRPFAALFVSYGLEGVGYIIAGTFLVAALSPGWVGSGAWVIVGLAAIPSAALWAWLGRRWSRPWLLTVALVVQAVGVALPAVVGGVVGAVIAAALFGGTFVGIATLALAVGADLHFPRSVALLTAGYSVGQILGPVVAGPLLRHGYRPALVLAAGILLAGAAAAGVLARMRPS